MEQEIQDRFLALEARLTALENSHSEHAKILAPYSAVSEAELEIGGTQASTTSILD